MLQRGILVIIRGRGAAVGDNLGENENHHCDNIALLRTRTHTPLVLTVLVEESLFCVDSAS